MQVYLREMVLTIATVDYSTSVKNPWLYSKPGDTSDVSLAEARQGGGDDEYLKFDFLQNTVSGSIWRKIMDSAGSEALFRYALTTDEDSPYMAGTVIISRGTGDFTILGGDTTTDPKKRAWSSVEWKLKGNSSLVVPA